MYRLVQFATHIFPSNPASGRIGSVEMNIWLAQVMGLPLLGLKAESLRLTLLLTFYGIIMLPAFTFLYTGLEMYDLVLNRHSLDIFTQNACLSLTHLAGVWKIVNVFHRLPDIRKAIEKLKTIVRKFVLSDKQRSAFMRGEIENKLFLTIYATLVGLTGLMGVAFLIYHPQGVAGQIFPFRVWLPAWLPHNIQLTFMGISVVLLALQIVSIDYMNISMLNQLRYQFDILILAFDEITSNDSDAIPQKRRKIAHDPMQKLTLIIQHHNALIDLRNNVESIFRQPILVQFFTSLLIFALTGFRASVSTGSEEADVIIYCYCTCILCELFFYCWFGNEVYEKGKTLSMSGFSSSWYEFDHSFRKSLLIFLPNAQQPFLFTAGGFMGLTLPSFAGILSKSYSFIALLRQFYSQ